MNNLQSLAETLADATRIVVFTGAGVSTDSGIPDYRGAGGQWKRFQPVYYEEFLADPKKRVEHWEHKAAVWPAIRDARPGSAHEVARRIFDRGSLQGVITQNIDGLHEKSGIPSERVVNLHGTNLKIECIKCGTRWDARTFLDPVAERRRHKGGLTEDDVPTCPQCGALVKPATIMFGQSLNAGDLARAEAMLVESDLMLAMGSTLTVQPAASIPVMAQRHGAKLAIVTRGETPLDHLAEYRYDGDLGEFADAVLSRLGGG
jgi:NAD-dependent deacetylase